jgi:hypothetical protein
MRRWIIPTLLAAAAMLLAAAPVLADTTGPGW